VCTQLCRKHFHAAIPALSCSCHLQPIQSSGAAGSFVSQMARRRRRGENWRGTLCGYRETRKQKEHGGGKHMSARATPQGRSDGRRVAMRGRGVAGRKGRGVACSALLRCSAAGGTRGRKWRLPARRIWRCNPAQITRAASEVCRHCRDRAGQSDAGVGAALRGSDAHRVVTRLAVSIGVAGSLSAFLL
jgi:hypothetical protein